MAVQFRCPCGANLRSSESIAGKKITCPKCGTQLQIKPAAEPRPERPAPAVATPKPIAKSAQATSPLDESDWTSEQNSLPSTPASTLSYRSKKSSDKSIGKWIAIGAGAASLVVVAGLLMLNRKSSVSSAFQAAESKPLPATSAPTGSDSTVPISGSVGPETTNPNSPGLKLAEEFASYARQGSADLALRMIANEDFEKRLNDGPTASWEAIMKKLKTPRVLGHLRSKSLESTPLDEGFRHWRVLGETRHEGQPAVLLRYYSDPEYPHQLINSSDKMLELTQIISLEEFKSNATDLVLYNAKGRNRNAPPSMPDTHGFLPPRFGYMLLVLDNSGDKPDTDYKKRIDKANSFGRKAFSFYGTVAQTGDFEMGNEVIQSPPLWFREPQNLGPDFKQKSNKTINEWLASHEPSRTTMLIKVANALDQSSSNAAGFINDFKKQYPGDPGADLAVISFAMTSLEPRMPESLLGVIDQSAESLFKTFNDPFMLFVRGLVHQAKGDPIGSAKFMLNQSGFGQVIECRGAVR